MEDSKYRQLYRRLLKIESMLTHMYDSSVPEDKKRQCPICRQYIRLYLPAGEKLRPNAMCPVCGSLERHRSLYLYLKNEIDTLKKSQNNSIIRVLHFAPEVMLQHLFVECKNIDYYPVDIDPGFPGIRQVVDITHQAYEDDFFDIIICNHVLEHIVDEKSALSELYRVLKHDNGVAYLNSPISWKNEFTIEKSEYNTPELRSKYYGQIDHVRLYGRDYCNRLEAAGFSVNPIPYGKQFDSLYLQKYGLSSEETIIECKKTII